MLSFNSWVWWKGLRGERQKVFDLYMASYNLSNLSVGQRKPFIYRKAFGKVADKHDDVNMHGWFQKFLKSGGSLSAQREQKAKVTKNSVSSVSSVSTSSASSFCASSSSSPGATPSKPLQTQSALSSPQRWSRQYDVFVCNSSEDSDSKEAGHLVSFLEASPRHLRCFLRHRDDCPGGAVSTELCQAMQNSHLWVLLITPNFLTDDWCMYMMHQALAEGPMSNRIIPMIQNLSRSQYPRELKFFFFIDLSHDAVRGYTLLHKTVLTYLEDLVKKVKTPECNMDSCSNGLSGEDSSETDTLMSKYVPTENSFHWK